MKTPLFPWWSFAGSCCEARQALGSDAAFWVVPNYEDGKQKGYALKERDANKNLGPVLFTAKTQKACKEYAEKLWAERAETE